MYHADIHLRHTQVVINKIISDAIHVVLGKEVPSKVNALGETEYWVKGARILPKTAGGGSVWARWAASNSLNAWWLVDFAFQINQEIRYRFNSENTDTYLRLQEWATKGVMEVFKKKGDYSQGIEFPVVLPLDWLTKMPVDALAKTSVIDIYRSYYAAQKGKVRMRWTKREKPDFIIEDCPF